MPSLRSESSSAARMLSGARPLRSGWSPTFVATTMSSRLPRAASQAAMIRSDCPGSFPGNWYMYESAVSTKFPPAAA
ncbi:hypothetical protein GA0115246_104502 [Streptomyces sp. SolWspMP-sol7th]|nr:hypothetical protein GA0115246_104502 [Streptomyces sp. SolWspMP-sol7th]